MINPFCDYLRFDYDASEEPLFLCPETDCLRIYSRGKHDLLRAVSLVGIPHFQIPVSLFAACAEGSHSPSATLLEASSEMTLNIDIDDASRSLRSLAAREILDGALLCVDAATEELSPLRQEQLLRAATFGGSFIGDASLRTELADAVPRAAHELRELNMLRRAEIGLFLTKEEWKQMGETAVITRLVARRQFLLAVKVASSVT